MFKVYMTLNRPTKEGYYFCQYHPNFEPVFCSVVKKNRKLWLNTRSTSRPLNKVKAFCFSERM
jgi:hypothetical protein